MMYIFLKPQIAGYIYKSRQVRKCAIEQTFSIKNTLKTYSHNTNANKYQNIFRLFRKSMNTPLDIVVKLYTRKHRMKGSLDQGQSTVKTLLSSRWHLFYLFKISLKKELAQDLESLNKYSQSWRDLQEIPFYDIDTL